MGDGNLRFALEVVVDKHYSVWCLMLFLLQCLWWQLLGYPLGRGATSKVRNSTALQGCCQSPHVFLIVHLIVLPVAGGGNRHQSHSPSPVPREVTSKGLDQVKKGRNMDSERMGHREGDYQRRRVEDGAVERPTASHSRSLHSDHDQSRRPLAGTSDYCEQGQSNRGTRPHSHHEHLRSDSDRLGRYDRPEQYGGGYREKDVDRGVQMFKVKERDTEREKGRDRDRVRGSDDDYLRSKDQEREPKRSRESDDRKRVDCSRDAGELIDADRPREWQEIRRRDLHRERDMVKDQSRERIMDRDRAWPRIRRDEEPTVKDQSRHRNLDKERSWSRDNRDEEGAELRKRNCRDIGGEGTAASAGTSVLHRDTNGGKGERVEWDGGENDSRRDTSEIHKVVRGKGERDRREREKGVTGWDQILMQDTTGTDEGATSCSIDKTVQHEVATPIDSSVDPKPELKDKAEETDGSKGARHSISAFQPTVPDSGQGQEKQVPSSSVVKPVKISKWGPPPSSEDAMTAELANDLNAAKVAALRAAELGEYSGF